MATGRLEIDTKVRVKFSGTVWEKPTPALAATNKVTQNESSRWIHYLYLGSSQITGDSKRVGDQVDVEFDAEVTGAFETGPINTTQVLELDGNGRPTGYIHYLFLASDEITVIEPEPPATAEAPPVTVTRAEEPAKAPRVTDLAGRARLGDTIAVDITAKVIGSAQGSRSCTCEVNENGFTHFLYLGSGNLTRKASDNRIISGQLTALVTGEPNAGETLTTEVREINSDGAPTDSIHYVYLGSPSVTVTRRAGEEGKGEPASAPVAQPVGGTPIRPGDEQFESKDVLARIAELEGLAPATFSITRARTGERYGASIAFLTRAAAEEYLDELDYNPARFVIEPVPNALSAEDAEELRLLQLLNDSGRTQFGRSQWITSSVLLRKDSFFTAAWARDEAVVRLASDPSRLTEWPLSLLDWGIAASRLLMSEYLFIYWGTAIYLGKKGG